MKIIRSGKKFNVVAGNVCKVILADVSFEEARSFIAEYDHKFYQEYEPEVFDRGNVTLFGTYCNPNPKKEQ